MCELLAQAGIASDEEHERGLDHGVFVPFKLIYPDADIAVVQVSLQKGLDAAQYILAGHSLLSGKNMPVKTCFSGYGGGVIVDPEP